MTSKELLDHLAEMKIPAKSASSALEDAYVSMVKKKLAPVLEARAAEIEAQKQAEKEAAEREEAEKAAAAEGGRLEAGRLARVHKPRCIRARGCRVRRRGSEKFQDIKGGESLEGYKGSEVARTR
ncbi:hypothetical protein [Collinsella ihumii]|uniref:hypothetical protein n=1 Tax=Collinsella ihumii TaxID=1720204 RepID=UPI00082ECACE